MTETLEGCDIKPKINVYDRGQQFTDIPILTRLANLEGSKYKPLSYITL